MRIGQVADTLGIPASTIRYYERAGLLTPPRKSGARQFNERTLFTLRFVQLAQSAGFSIAEIRILLDSYTHDASPGAMWKLLAAEKQVAIQNQIAELCQVETILGQLLECRCQSLESCVESACKGE